MKILVIEDEKEIRTFLKKSLEAECFIVDTAENGEAGVDLIEHNDYDLVYKTMKRYIDKNKLKMDLYIGKQNVVGKKIYLG